MIGVVFRVTGEASCGPLVQRIPSVGRFECIMKEMNDQKSRGLRFRC